MKTRSGLILSNGKRSQVCISFQSNGVYYYVNGSLARQISCAEELVEFIQDKLDKGFRILSFSNSILHSKCDHLTWFVDNGDYYCAAELTVYIRTLPIHKVKLMSCELNLAEAKQDLWDQINARNLYERTHSKCGTITDATGKHPKWVEAKITS